MIRWSLRFLHCCVV